MSFCNQMTAAIDGARTLTRLDLLSRSIWQGLAAGAVADDDAQALAERLHARRSLLRGDLKPAPPTRPGRPHPSSRPARAHAGGVSGQVGLTSKLSHGRAQLLPAALRASQGP